MFIQPRTVLIMVASLCSLGSNRAAAAEDIKPLDGVNIEAIETYQNPKSTQLDFGLGIWPMSAFYTGFSLDLGYTYYFNKTLAVEAHGDYVYTVDKNLSSNLAENYNVDPVQIQRLNMVISGNFQYTLAYGKMIFAKEYVRYFRNSLLAGVSYVATNKRPAMGIDAGYKFEVFINESFSWKLELRDLYVFSSLGNNLTFIFGTAYGL
jgi:outer membrane beta-barrel protein